MSISERIKQRRIELSMSQEELAKKIGYKSKSSINKIEKDSRSLPRSKIEVIAKALNVAPEYIMGWEEREGYNPKTDKQHSLARYLTVLGYQCERVNYESDKLIPDKSKPRQRRIIIDDVEIVFTEDEWDDLQYTIENMIHYELSKYKHTR